MQTKYGWHIVKLIDKSNHEERVAEIISDTILEVKQLKIDKKRKKDVLDKVTKANTLLVEANTIKSHETEKEGVSNQLDSLEKELNKLRIWADSV